MTRNRARRTTNRPWGFAAFCDEIEICERCEGTKTQARAESLLVIAPLLQHTINPIRVTFGGLTVFNRGSRRVKERKEMSMSLMPVLAELSGNVHVGLAALGAALGVGFIGMKASEAVGRNPGAATKILVQSILAIAFAEAIVFYALFLVRG
jgi:F-type H+-transporting ATPase subunit c